MAILPAAKDALSAATAAAYDRASIEAILHGCFGRTGLREAYVSMT
jgi:hypothetical protein